MFVRYFLYNELILKTSYHKIKPKNEASPQQGDDYTALTFGIVLIISEAGQIIVGVVCKYWFYGRKTFLFLVISGFSLLLDLIILVLILVEDKEFRGTLFCVLLLLDGLCTFMLYYLSLFVSAFDLGKIQLLRFNVKIFGSVLSMVIFTSFFLLSFVFYNIEIAILSQKQQIKTTYCYLQAAAIGALVLSLIPIFSIYREEKKEISVMRENMLSRVRHSRRLNSEDQ